MILLKDVTKYYGSFKALEKISFDVPSGDSLVISGPSGSGKTTLLRLVAGLETVDEGEIHINSSLVSKPGWNLTPHKRGLGFIFQSPALWPHMTVRDHILFGLSGLTAEERRERVEDTLKRTGLTGLAHRYPHQISGGEARRVSIARTIAPKPPCLLMDEPLTNLDSGLKSDLLDFIKEIVRENKSTLLYVTHDEEEGRKISQNIFTMKKS